MANITNQDIFLKIGGLSSDVSNMAQDIKNLQDDVKQIKKDTANFPIVKSIVFGMVAIIVLAFMGFLVNVVIPHNTTAQANSLPAVSVSKPGQGQ